MTPEEAERIGLRESAYRAAVEAAHVHGVLITPAEASAVAREATAMATRLQRGQCLVLGEVLAGLFERAVTPRRGEVAPRPEGQQLDIYDDCSEIPN